MTTEIQTAGGHISLVQQSDETWYVIDYTKAGPGYHFRTKTEAMKYETHRRRVMNLGISEQKPPPVATKRRRGFNR